MTVGVDIGSTAVKAVAVDEVGRVLARARVPHEVSAPGPDLLQHDAGRAWRLGPRKALAEVSTGLEVAGVGIAGMVPSLTAVNRRGVPMSPGLLYGDARGVDGAGAGAGGDFGGVPDGTGFVRWAVREHPEARGYWPAQAVAAFALAGVPVIDGGTSMSFPSLLGRGGTWRQSALADAGVRADQMPTIVPLGTEAGRVAATGSALAAGTVDAFCDQIVAGADEPGDVLVVFGATLIVWAVIAEHVDAPGLWTLPHTTPERLLVGGPSNAGALFVDWARSLVSGGGRGRAGRNAAPAPLPSDPGRVPVWLPYPRGERAPFHDPGLRASLHGLDLTHDAAAVERAAFEASGFVIRHMLDRAGARAGARRIVASGGGTRVGPGMQAVADATGLVVDTVAVHEGAALGAAFLGRMAAGLETSLAAAGSWARSGGSYEPDAVCGRGRGRAVPALPGPQPRGMTGASCAARPSLTRRTGSAMLGAEVTGVTPDADDDDQTGGGWNFPFEADLHAVAPALHEAQNTWLAQIDSLKAPDRKTHELIRMVCTVALRNARGVTRHAMLAAEVGATWDEVAGSIVLSQPAFGLLPAVEALPWARRGWERGRAALDETDGNNSSG